MAENKAPKNPARGKGGVQGWDPADGKEISTEVFSFASDEKVLRGIYCGVARIVKGTNGPCKIHRLDLTGEGEECEFFGSANLDGKLAKVDRGHLVHMERTEDTIKTGNGSMVVYKVVQGPRASSPLLSMPTVEGDDGAPFA